MKKIYIIIFLCIFCIGNNLYAQECGNEDNGITTNPEEAINDQCPAKKNTFDWTANKFYAPYYSASSAITSSAINDTILSPFFNSGNTTIDELWRVSEYGPRDMKPEDGWEMVVNGLSEAPVNTPFASRKIAYFVLYNKFTATLRVFGAHEDVGDQNDYFVIRLKFSPNKDEDITGALFPTQQIAQPLDKTSITEVHANAKIVSTDPLYFFYADFPIGYDPCTCMFEEGKFDVIFQAINEQKLSLYGRSWAIDKDLANIDGGNNTSSDFLTNVYSLEDKAQAGSLIFNSWNELTTLYGKQKVALLDLKEQYQAFADLKTALDLAATVAGLSGLVIPTGIGTDEPGKFKVSTLTNPLKLASKFVDVLSAPLKKKVDNAKGAVEATGKVRMIQSELTFSGTLSDVSQKEAFSFNLPGRAGESDCNDPYNNNLYPYYNEVLGRFALLETPILDIGIHRNYQTKPTGIQRFRLNKSSIKYMFNPAAKINVANTKIYAAFIVEKDKNILSNVSVSGMEKINSLSLGDTVTYISPFVPLDCIGNITGEFSKDFISSAYPAIVTDGKFDEYIDLKLRLIIFYEFEPINIGDVPRQAFEVLTYPLRASQLSLEYTDIPPPITNNGVPIVNKLVIGSTNYTTSQTIFAWDTIIINGDLSTGQGVEVELIAPVIIMNSGSVGQGITLSNAEFPVSCSPIIPFNPAGLESFCKSGNYSANKPSSKRSEVLVPTGTNSELQKNVFFQSSPNPFNHSFLLTFELSEASTTSLTIYNALGQIVEIVLLDKELPEGIQQYRLEGSNWPMGIYYAELKHKDGNQTIKLIKQ